MAPEAVIHAPIVVPDGGFKFVKKAVGEMPELVNGVEAEEAMTVCTTWTKEVGGMPRPAGTGDEDGDEDDDE